MAHFQSSSRSRPEPLSLHGSNNATQRSSSDRVRLLSSLRSAPPSTQQQQHQQQYANYQQPQQQQQEMDPRSAAYLQFQHAQTAYLQELQRQILVKQNEIWINQQQIEAEAALRQLTLVQHEREREREREREWNAGMEREREREEIQQARSNPLVASALARRKRQSLQNLPPSTTSNLHERHTTPPPSHSHSPPSSASSSVRSTPPPPAVILSAPGEPYPDTSSSASGSESGETRPSTPSSTTNSSPRLQLETNSPSTSHHHQFVVVAAAEEQERRDQFELDRELKSSRRRSSHLDQLSNALGGRQKRRPVSMGGSPLQLAPQLERGGSGDVNTPRPNQITFPQHASPRSPRPSQHQTTPRSVSDSHTQHLLRSPVANSNSSISTPHVSVRPPTLPGHAFAVRQPKGPPTNLGSVEGGGEAAGGEEINFGTRIRQKAIENLRGGLRTRRAGGQ